jgi:hemerythrin
MFFVWKESMAVDHGLIDADHRHLIEIMDGVMILLSNKAPQGAVIAMMKALADFGAEHFRREELLQEAAGYPAALEHRRIHEKLLADLRQYIMGLSDLSCADLSPAECRERMHETKRFLTRWLIEHILGEDVKLRPYVEDMERQAANLAPLRGMVA